MKGTIVGKEISKYKKDGEDKVSRNLYVVWDAPKHATDGMEGQKCEAVFVPFDLPDGVNVGINCEFEYEIQQTRKGAIARLVDIIPIKEMQVLISEIK